MCHIALLMIARACIILYAVDCHNYRQVKIRFFKRNDVSAGQLNCWASTDAYDVIYLFQVLDGL